MPENQQAVEAQDANAWAEDDWVSLLYAIRFKKCTPFLGAGACDGVLPLGRTLAEEWAKEFHYPFQDTQNLVRVAQYVAIERDAMLPKFKLIERFADKGPPDFNNPNEPHRVVADLRLPVYITTNYDDFMFRALARDLARKPRREVCRWYMARRRRLTEVPPSFEATADSPVVFHLHGVLGELESMVLTEDDYLDFLMYISEVESLIPTRIQQALAESSLLFLGYSLEDLDFKVLFRRISSFMQINQSPRHVAVQLSPLSAEAPEEQRKRAEKQRLYLARHLKLQNVKIYWGRCQDFATELRARWEKFNAGR